jgi:hypothetical protein
VTTSVLSDGTVVDGAITRRSTTTVMTGLQLVTTICRACLIRLQAGHEDIRLVVPRQP